MTQEENNWIQPVPESALITTEQLDEAVREMRKLRVAYEEQKDIAASAHADYEEAVGEVVDLLKSAGKSKYFVEDLGTVSIANKYSVKVPKENTDKLSFFHFIEEKFGEDTLVGMLSIHSATLNAFVNELKKNEPLTEVPGLGAPTHEEVLRFTARK